MASTAISFLIISAAIISLWYTPVEGYEVSIYQGTPLVFWIAIILGMFNGAFLLYRFYRSGQRIWTVGLLELALCDLLMVSVYLLRGSFFLGKGDALSYVGYSLDLIRLGHIPVYNFYPIFTTLISLTSEITGIPVFWLTQVYPAFFLVFYVLSVFCWARSMSGNRLFVASMLFASAPIFFAWFMPPLFYQSMAVMVIPFFFYSLQKGASGDLRFRTITFLLLVFFAIAHQIVAAGVLVYLVVIFVAERRILHTSRLVSVSHIVFLFVILFAWIFTQPALINDFTYMLQQIIDSFGGPSTFETAQASASKVGLLSALQSILLCTIDDIVFLFLSLLAGITVLRTSPRSNTMATYFFCLLGGLVMLLAMVFAATVHSSPFRLINLNFSMILTIPLAGYLLCSQRNKGHRLRTALVVTVILISIASSVTSFYQDPIGLNPNGTITASEIPGDNWLVSFQKVHNHTFALETIPYRFADMLYGRGYNQEHFPGLDGVVDPGDHFVNPLSTNGTYDGYYLILSKYDETSYTEVWKSYDRFNSNDFKELDVSTEVSRIYASSGTSCYLCV